MTAPTRRPPSASSRRSGEALTNRTSSALRAFLGTLPRSLKEGLSDARGDNGVATLNDPATLKFLLQLARRGAGGGSAPSGSAPDMGAIRNARRRELEQMIGNRNSAYFREGSLQSEYRDLIDQGASGDAAPRVADDAIGRRIAELENWMGARRGTLDYKRYWDDPSIQRHAELLDRRERARK